MAMEEKKEIKVRYSKEGVSVLWQPHICIHSGVCVRGLPAVFNTRKSPWINVEAASAEEIIHQVHQCPSGALSLSDEKKKPEQTDHDL
jgi:uncharacterized Fe-S cluster protein YjdI